MPALTSENNPITSDGTYTLGGLEPHRYVIAAAGAFGGGSLAVNWSDGTNSVPFDESPLTASGGFEASIPGNRLSFVLTGSTAPSITITATSIQ